MTDKFECAIFAGGCFWCMVSPFDKMPGIVSVVSGYTGGDTENPTYEEVCLGITGHVEAVEIKFDPDIISYRDLMEIYWQVTDPTDASGQFQDRGSQYQPIIFYNSPEQLKVAEESKEKLAESNKFTQPIVTRIEKAEPFFAAEDYHQDFYRKNPLRYQLEEMGGRKQFIKKNWTK